MRGSPLGHLMMRLRFNGMNKVRKLQCVLDKEDGDIVPDEIVIPLFRIKLDGKTAHVTGKSVAPREPTTVEKRTKTGVFTAGS